MKDFWEINREVFRLKKVIRKIPNSTKYQLSISVDLPERIDRPSKRIVLSNKNNYSNIIEIVYDENYDNDFLKDFLLLIKDGNILEDDFVSMNERYSKIGYEYSSKKFREILVLSGIFIIKNSSLSKFN